MLLYNKLFANLVTRSVLGIINRIQGPYREILGPRCKVQKEFARSVRKKQGLSILRYGTSSPVNSVLDDRNENIPNIQREFAENLPKNCLS